MDNGCGTGLHYLSTLLEHIEEIPYVSVNSKRYHPPGQPGDLALSAQIVSGGWEVAEIQHWRLINLVLRAICVPALYERHHTK